MDLQEQSRGKLLQLSKSTVVQKVTPRDKENFVELYYGSQSDLLDTPKAGKEEELSAIHFGLGLHYMLEMMEDFTLGSISQAYHTLQNRYGMLLEVSELKEISRRVEMLVCHDDFQKLLKNADYTKEQPLKYKKNLYYLDLLIQNDTGYIVVDYKSGKMFHEEHIKQVRTYKTALGAITKKRVDGYLCYLLEDGVEIIAVK